MSSSRPTQQETASASAGSNGTTTSSSRLQAVHYANVVAFAVNVLVTFGAPAAGLPDNGTLSAKYQTLVTPAGYAFAIWGIIFLAQLIWTIGQLLPAYRTNPLVLKGVGYGYVWTCLAQCAWTICFGLEKIILSLVAMVLILIPLVMILMRFDDGASSAGSTGKYWLLKFPFEIHAAWIMAATLVNLNVVLVAQDASANLQTWVGWICLAVVILVSLFYTLAKQVWVVPCVLAWASTAIAAELAQPKDSIATTFSSDIIQHTQIAARVVATLCLAVMVAKILYNRFYPTTQESTAYSSL